MAIAVGRQQSHVVSTDRLVSGLINSSYDERTLIDGNVQAGLLASRQFGAHDRPPAIDSHCPALVGRSENEDLAFVNSTDCVPAVRVGFCSKIGALGFRALRIRRYHDLRAFD